MAAGLSRLEPSALAIAEAEATVDRIDAEISALREEQGRHGSRAGLLQQSIDQMS
jgi:hypothetical protein